MRWIIRFVIWIGAFACLVLAIASVAAMLRESDDRADILPDAGRLVTTEDGQIFVLEAGPEDGDPLLFAHGTAAWSGLWGPVLEAKGADGWRAVGFDMPPFGFSDHASDGDYSRPRQAQRILALVEAMEMKPIFVAHSVGAGPSVEAVMENPQAFAGLIVVGGALALGRHEEDATLPLPLRPAPLRKSATALTMTNPWLTRTFLSGFVHKKDAVTDDRVTLLQRPLTRDGTSAAYADWLPNLLVPPQDARSTRAEEYQALDLPVVYIWGKEDTTTPLAQAEELVALTPGARLITLPGVGHIPQIEDTPAFLLALDRALGLIASQNSAPTSN
ncbi:MAG: alpha/beta hydrolase [Pseudomonadota bacterium]